MLGIAMLAEVLQVLRGAGKVGAAFANTQGEQLRLLACNSTLGSGVKAVQDAVESWTGSTKRRGEVENISRVWGAGGIK